MQYTPHFLPKHCKLMSQRYTWNVPNRSTMLFQMWKKFVDADLR